MENKENKKIVGWYLDYHEYLPIYEDGSIGWTYNGEEKEE